MRILPRERKTSSAPQAFLFCETNKSVAQICSPNNDNDIGNDSIRLLSMVIRTTHLYVIPFFFYFYYFQRTNERTTKNKQQTSNVSSASAAAAQQQHQHHQQQGVVDFAVYIVGCGPWRGTLVYAILVSQPVQSWTVVRRHEEFVAVSQALQTTVPSIPPCPQRAASNAVVPTAQRVQAWMTHMVSSAAARATLQVREFFTTAANTLPAVYEGVPWTNFATGPLTTATLQHTAFRQHHQQHQHHHQPEVVAEMDMDDMFFAGGDDAGHEDDDPAGEDDEDEDYYDNNHEDVPAYPRACDRYKPTDETVDSEDEMEILNMDEVEMIEDLGSLAQSLGASHLGRSLQLQAEMMARPSAHNKQHKQQQHGLHVGGAPLVAAGGLGSAMMAAAAAGSDVPSAAPPMATPRLDSFKMIKVIGKGSFGKFDCGVGESIIILLAPKKIKVADFLP